MKKISLTIRILFHLIFTTSVAFAQIVPYPTAPEIWSAPEPIQVITDNFENVESPSITADGKKLYFSSGRVTMIEKTDIGWSQPVFVDSALDGHLLRAPFISPNGKRIHLSQWTGGGWDLFYSDWNDILQKWNPLTNAGPGVNDPESHHIGGCMVNDTTLIFLETNYAAIAYWNSNLHSYGKSIGFPKEDHRDYSQHGIYVTPDFSKIYTTGITLDTFYTGFNYDLMVKYEDSSMPLGYTRSYRLNISLEADSLYLSGIYKDVYESFPFLTPDGKTMYFMALYHDHTEIYESHMLIDENGDPVSVNENPNTMLPDKIELYQNYPNPFSKGSGGNPSTTIKYQLKDNGYVKLTIYDIVGKKVKELFNGYQRSGVHIVKFSAATIKGGLPSGIYIISLSANIGSGYYRKTVKAVLVK